MPVKALLRASFALAMLLSSLPAQFRLGAALPAPRWTSWQQGEPVDLGGDVAPPCTAFAFFTRPHLDRMLASDAAYLCDLQQRFAARGFVVVAVVSEPLDETQVAAWPGCRVVVDAEAATATEWLAGPEPIGPVVVVDQKGNVAFQGSLDSGLVDAVVATLGDGNPLEAEQMAAVTRSQLPANFDDMPAAMARDQVEAVLAHAPHDGGMFGLLYLTEVAKAADVAAAERVRQRAMKALAGESRPLAAFADLALRGDPRSRELAHQIAGLLRPLVGKAPNDAPLQLVYLRALVLAGDGREVGRHAMRMQKVVLGSTDHCLDFVGILVMDENPLVHRDLAARVLAKAGQAGASLRLLTAAKYAVALRCDEDRQRAQAILNEYLGEVEIRSQINNDCWYLMTELPTMGRFDWFAMALAERMLEQRDAMDYFEFDTAALAMFQVGRFAEAVELQETAISKGGQGNPEYAERLQRYKAKVAPAPR